ncbi:MAG: transcription-repair coupling factor [Lentisphaerae bacterium]|jgi:transcription-repair coupling factor (superfamily II helicase)|nr:transcription-repair coupling factor [Lentisphaerota bacterium]
MTEWREKFKTWARSAALPPGSCQLGLYDEDLLSAGLAQVLASRNDGSLIVVTSDSSRLDAVAASLESFRKLLGDDRSVIPLPEVALNRQQWVPENEAGRCAALETALSGKPAIYVTTATVLMSATISPTGFQERTFTLRRGDEVDLESLAKRLVDLDYDNEFEVCNPGEFSRRGGIIDIYSPLYDAPVRLEFWGNEIDRMRFFMPDSQVSFRDVEELRIVPRGVAVLVAPEEDSSTVLEYFPPKTPLVLCDPEGIAEHLETYSDDELQEQWQDTLATAVTVQLLTGPAENVGHAAGAGSEGRGTGRAGATDTEAVPVLRIDALSLGAELADMLPELGDGAALWHWQQLRDALTRWATSDYTVVACCAGSGEAERFREMLQEDEKTRELPIQVEEHEIDRGLLLPSVRLVLLSDQELFGRKAPVRRQKHLDYRRDQAVCEAMELEEGELAVHVTHGICLYHGIRYLESGGELQEVVELEFADDARLYVPLDQVSLISRYLGAGKGTPTLNKLGGVAWRNARDGAAEAAQDLAAELLRVEAIRQQAEGVRFKPQIEWERAFANAFPYTETADQTDAIQAVLADMEDSKPMDRLLCGDVGYGKTEVAMRAAFRAVLNGHQVAVLTPTTVLAQQHLRTFRERFAEYPVVVEMISRFRTAAEQREILDRVALGEVDILIGTHRILQKDVDFARLGLLVIDEEQRFGVKHKQRLKSMRANLDILTMTATPIPRTLYFSLSGIRNLSTIMTAPSDRLPINTIVAQFDRELIRQAILRELERGGQVYFLYNRVQTIGRMLTMLSGLVPTARIAIAHGQMGAGQLETVMARFIRGEIDVLLCTTIIESGVDIPNVNTIIIDRADRFGLSDLYQLRGRVGRYHRQAYAYLLLPPMGQLPANARQRLAAIRRYTHLGAGFRLAMRDLEIRGAGNILGVEQSGHIAAVGFELYCQLLKDAVDGLEKSQLERPVQTDIYFDRLSSALQAAPGKTAMCLPAAYIGDEAARVDCYKRLSQISKPSEVDVFANELRDRFGPLPSATVVLLELARVRAMALERQLIRLSVRERRLVIETRRGLWRDSRNKIPELSSDDGLEQLHEVQAILRRVG